MCRRRLGSDSGRASEGTPAQWTLEDHHDLPPGYPPDRVEEVSHVVIGILISRPIAQMKPASSLAIAVTTTVGFLPLAIIERYRLHSLVCAFHAIYRMLLGRRTRISAFSFAMRAGYW